MNPFITRIWYLVSRLVVRPERAFSVVAGYHPVADVTLITILSLLWNALLAVLPPARLMMGGHISTSAAMELYAVSVCGIAAAMLIVGFLSICVSITVMLLGAHPRFLSTQLCFQLSVSVALALAALPVTLIKIVDVGEHLSTVSASLITVGPWLYILVLMMHAVLKIQRTVPTRAVAYLGLAMMPVILLTVVLWRSFAIEIPLGFG